MSSQVKAQRVAEYRAKKTGIPLTPKPAAAKEEPAVAEAPKPRPVLDIPPVKKLFVHVKDPEDHAALLSLKQVCGNFVGNTDIVLVLGADKTSAIRLPFRVDASEELIGELVKLLGEDCVALK